MLDCDGIGIQRWEVRRFPIVCMLCLFVVFWFSLLCCLFVVIVVVVFVVVVVVVVVNDVVLVGRALQQAYLYQINIIEINSQVQPRLPKIHI